MTPMAWADRLKSRAALVDLREVHFESLTIEAGDATFALHFDPRMTVIAGVGPAEREGLIAELVGGLSSGRSGVHLEICSDAGAHYAVRRPAGGPHRVIDLDEDRDVTAAFTSPDGRVNVLERAGLDVRGAKQAMRVIPTDLTTRSEAEERILALAHVEQSRLWDVAEKVKDREAAVADAAGELGDPIDASVLAEIERRHAEFEVAEADHEAARRVSLLVGANAAALALLLLLLGSLAIAIPFLLLAVGMTAYSARYWQRMEKARSEEERALEAAGAQSYMTFQINRVNGLLANDHHRKQMMKAAEYHRAAVAEWQLLAGDVPVDWALEYKRQIRTAASKLRDTVDMRNPMAVTMSRAETTTADLTHALLRRLSQVRSLGAGGESFPIFLDEPFTRVPAELKPELLGVLLDASQKQQVIFLTEDEDVAGWARLESLAEHLTLVEPTDRSEQAQREQHGNGETRHAVA
jgi:hypothetical protein